MAALRQAALHVLRAVTPRWVRTSRPPEHERGRIGPAIEPAVHIPPVISETVLSASVQSAVNTPDPLTDVLLLQRYRVQEHIRQAGTADVYQALDERTGEPVAIKISRADHDSFSPEQCVQILLRELDLLERLDHPNVVGLIDSGLHNDRIFLVLEYLPGFDLYEAMPTRRSLQALLPTPAAIYGSWEYGRYVISELCTVLEAIHAARIIHRDLKPSNVRLTPSPFLPRVTLLDFGLAKLVDESIIDHPAHTLGTIEGTPEYLAPEQIRRHLFLSRPGDVCRVADISFGARAHSERPREYDHRVDIYALGVILYQFLCGRLPFEGAPIQTMLMHLHDVPPAPSELRPDLVIPADAEALVLRLLEKDPDRRFQSAAELKVALQGCGSVFYTK